MNKQIKNCYWIYFYFQKPCSRINGTKAKNELKKSATWENTENKET